jgi:heat shock protein HtpX
MNILGEINCFGLCLKLSELAPFVALLIVISIALLAASFMIRRLNAKPIGNVIGWMQEFTDRLASATVYSYDSAVPGAFAAGKSIFVSLGLLELLSDDELKAVLAHEAWHIRNNGRTSYLKQLAIMTFSSPGREELEELADRFAAVIAGSEALSSAHRKVDKVFI